MFRRKEEGLKDENFNDSHADTSATSTTTGGTSSSASQTSGQPAAATQAPLSSFAAVPQTQPVARTISDVTRGAPAGVTGAPANTGYRPSPVSEFNRNAPVRQEAGRPAAGHQPAASSFGASADRHTPTKSSPRILTVGNDILLKGEIATCDRVVIEGRVEAKLSDVHTVEIAGCGSFKGTAEVEDAEVSGLFEGDLAVRNRLVIYATGEVRGNVTYGEIEVERGGKLTGQIKTGASGQSGATDKPNLLDVLDIKSRSKDKESAGA